MNAVALNVPYTHQNGLAKLIAQRIPSLNLVRVANLRGSEADFRDFQAGVAKRAVFHQILPPFFIRRRICRQG